MSRIDRERLAAVRTLERIGYTYHDGELWKPPLGKCKPPLGKTRVVRSDMPIKEEISFTFNDPEQQQAFKQRLMGTFSGSGAEPYCNPDTQSWHMPLPSPQMVAHDVSMALAKDREGKIRQALIDMGWTPPAGGA